MYSVRMMIRICFILLVMLAGCATDYENDYRLPHRTAQGAMSGALGGATLGKLSPLYTNPAALWNPGVLVGAVTGFVVDTDLVQMYRLNEIGVKVIEYGDNVTVVLPSDYFFDIDSGDLRYEREFTLLEIATLLSKSPTSPVSIMAFSDSVGSDEYVKELTQKQSRSILSFLWSHGIDHKRLHAFGYGKKTAIADTETVLGNGLNRRVEIHWRKLS